MGNCRYCDRPMCFGECLDDTARCEVSTNPVGTDTWKEGCSCPCGTCQAWLKTRPKMTPPSPITRPKGSEE